MVLQCLTIFSVNFTEQGIKNIKDSPKRALGEFLNLYNTLGKHDILVIVKAPNDKAIVSVLFSTAPQGTVRTRTLKASPMSEAANVIENLT